VPIIEAVTTSAERGSVRRIEGVLNGTCNFILNQVAAGCSFDDAVAAAQGAGYAESDPSRDLSGLDAAEKLVILARHAFGAEIDVSEVKRTSLSQSLINERRQDGHALRQVAWVEQDADSAIRAGVDIVALPPDSPFANLSGATNCLCLRSGSGPAQIIRGAGAGRWPTTEAVIADLLDLARARLNQTRSHQPEVLAHEL
jgi:homoserine dehydrogenase